MLAMQGWEWVWSLKFMQWCGVWCYAHVIPVEAKTVGFLGSQESQLGMGKLPTNKVSRFGLKNHKTITRWMSLKRTAVEIVLWPLHTDPCMCLNSHACASTSVQCVCTRTLRRELVVLPSHFLPELTELVVELLPLKHTVLGVGEWFIYQRA